MLTVVGRAPTFAQARARAYQAVDAITFPDKHVRTDIGLKAVQPEE